jgi:hypothetical protein
VLVLLETYIISCLQTILFTTDDTILELISQYDESFCSLLSQSQQDVENYHVERPVTADNGVSTRCICNGNSSCAGSSFLYFINCHPVVYNVRLVLITSVKRNFY